MKVSTPAGNNDEEEECSPDPSSYMHFGSFEFETTTKGLVLPIIIESQAPDAETEMKVDEESPMSKIRKNP